MPRKDTPQTRPAKPPVSAPGPSPKTHHLPEGGAAEVALASTVGQDQDGVARAQALSNPDLSLPEETASQGTAQVTPARVAKVISAPTEDKTQDQRPKEVERSRRRSELVPRVPGYELRKLLGKGTYGRVWLAREEKTGVEVAIKIFDRGTGQQWEFLQAEIRKLALLAGDPGIVHLRDVEPDARPPYFIMDYAVGGRWRGG